MIQFDWLIHIKPPTSFFFGSPEKKEVHDLVNQHSGSWKGWTRIFQMEPFHYWTWGYSSNRYVRNYQRVIEPKKQNDSCGRFGKKSVRKIGGAFFFGFPFRVKSFKSFSVFDVMVVVRWLDPLTPTLWNKFQQVSVNQLRSEEDCRTDPGSNMLISSWF